MEHNENRNDCVTQCEAEFIRYTARKRSGGIESLRICRERCPVSAP
jgi:hypothetical protein